MTTDPTPWNAPPGAHHGDQPWPDAPVSSLPFILTVERQQLFCWRCNVTTEHLILSTVEGRPDRAKCVECNTACMD